jgi:hypothetical protein
MNPCTRWSCPLPLAEFLRAHTYACLLQETDQRSVFICKAPAPEIQTLRGSIPIHVRYELYQQPTAPVIRTVVRLYDRPQNPLALETFTKLEDPQQRSEFGALADQDELFLLFFDGDVRHRLSKHVRIAGQGHIRRVLEQAERFLAGIPAEVFNFDLAKAQVMAETGP